MITRNTSFGHPDLPAPQGVPGLRHWLSVFSRHKGKMLLTFCTLFALFAVGLVLYPKSYSSESRLFVRLGKESVALDPTAAVHETVQTMDSRESEINSELEILRSRALLEDVVKELGTDEVLGAMSGKSSWLSMLTMPLDAVRLWLDGAVGAEEKAITKLSKAISVSSPRKSSVIIVKCKARDAGKAQTILQAYLNAYQVRHTKANRISGSHEFFVNQTDLLNQQLTLANQQLRDAKNDNGIASIEGQRQNIQSQADSIELAMLANKRALDSAQARVAALKKALSELPEKQLSEESDVPNPAVDSMRSELYRLEIQEKELSSRFTGLHPSVIAIRKQVEETRAILAQEESRRNQGTRRISPVYQSIQTDLATTQAEVAAMLAESESLQKQFEAVQSRIRDLNEKELQVTELERKAELLEASYRQYATYREQARIDGALEAGRISNINVVQPPTYVAKPASPSMALMLAVGFLLSLIGAVAAAVIVEALDPTLKTPEQFEQALGVPVLFSVPRNRDDLVRS